jgi:hypothetical protein
MKKIGKQPGHAPERRALEMQLNENSELKVSEAISLYKKQQEASAMLDAAFDLLTDGERALYEMARKLSEIKPVGRPLGSKNRAPRQKAHPPLCICKECEECTKKKREVPAL